MLFGDAVGRVVRAARIARRARGFGLAGRSALHARLKSRRSEGTGTRLASTQPSPARGGKRFHPDAAVEGENGTGYVAGVVLTQEADDACDLFRCAQALDGNAADHLLQRLLRHRSNHLSVDEARCDTVHGDAAPRRLQRQALGEAEQSRLGSGVVGLPDVAGFPDYRADVDDAAGGPLHHVVEDRLDHVEGAGEIDPEDGVPILHSHLAHRLVHGHAGVVDEQVNPASLPEHIAGDANAVLWMADVALVGGDGEALLRRLALEAVRCFPAAVVTGGDARAFLWQRGGDGGSDAAGAAGDNGNASIEIAHAVTPSLSWLEPFSGRHRSKRYESAATVPASCSPFRWPGLPGEQVPTAFGGLQPGSSRIGRAPDLRAARPVGRPGRRIARQPIRPSLATSSGSPSELLPARPPGQLDSRHERSERSSGCRED